MLYLVSMMDYVRNWAGVAVSDEDGQGLIEYVLIGALISIVAIAAIMLVGPDIVTQFDKIAVALPDA